MPDKRVPRGSKTIDTPGGEGTDYPMNSGGIDEYERHKTEDEDTEDKNLPKRLESEDPSGGFGVRPWDLNNSLNRGANMTKNDHFLKLTHDDVVDFIRGDSILSELVDYIRCQDEYSFNPPTQDEFAQMLQFAITREEGKNKKDDILSADARANTRENSSPKSGKEYADPANRAFPVDSKARVASAHAYIHKYWNSASKKGVTSVYGREDFVRVHNKIANAMQNFGIEHNYLDSLDDAAGFSKPKDSTTSKCDGMPCQKCNEASCNCDKCEKCGKDSKDCHCEPIKQTQSGIFIFAAGQTVVSPARNRMQEKGKILSVEGLMADVEWEDTGRSMELLAKLLPTTS